MKRIIKNSLKLALAGGVISAIWFVALTQTVDEPLEPAVAPAHADISTFSLGDDGNEFTRAMAELGLKPRPYDLNGNVMYFAAGTTDKLPLEMEKIVSSTLVEHGVNSQPTTERPAMRQAASGWEFPASGDDTPTQQQTDRNFEKLRPQREALMKGEVVTTVREKNFVRMESVQWKGTTDEMVAMMKDETIPNREKTGRDLMGGYRFIEAVYDADDGMSDISAVWSADGFDGRKMANKSFLQQEPDPNIPACMGCTRDFRMQSLDKNEPLRANKWHTTTSVSQTYEFYQRSMATRGWRESGVQAVLDQTAQIVPELAAIQGKLLHLEKDGESMQIALVSDGAGGTHVVSQERFEGAESILP